MRLSIVYDDCGTILSGSEGDDVTDRPVLAPGENVADFDVPDDLPSAGLLEAVERVADMDAAKLGPRTAQKEG